MGGPAAMARRPGSQRLLVFVAIALGAYGAVRLAAPGALEGLPFLAGTGDAGAAVQIAPLRPETAVTALEGLRPVQALAPARSRRRVQTRRPTTGRTVPLPARRTAGPAPAAPAPPPPSGPADDGRGTASAPGGESVTAAATPPTQT